LQPQTIQKRKDIYTIVDFSQFLFGICAIETHEMAPARTICPVPGCPESGCLMRNSEVWTWGRRQQRRRDVSCAHSHGASCWNGNQGLPCPEGNSREARMFKKGDWREPINEHALFVRRCAPAGREPVGASSAHEPRVLEHRRADRAIPRKQWGPEPLLRSGPAVEGRGVRELP